MPNRLARETSPYLQQHADNPVDWYPWGEEALTLARREDKPILLSVGYSACHWCHVMAHESFEDAAVAELMNRHFVNIKVDREERPDLDHIYQSAHQLLTQRHGGWPLTMFLTPDGTPFFGGTYFPREPRHGLPAFPELLARVVQAYRTRRRDIESQGEGLREALEAGLPTPGEASIRFSEAPLAHAVELAAASFDARHGGFGAAPKFPHPTDLRLLLRRHAAAGDARCAQMALLTLRRMAEGGIYDQLGGGFCRYSVDERWEIPHFEKMLYDNGPLLGLYADAWRLSGEPLFRRVAEETAAWALRRCSPGKAASTRPWTPTRSTRRASSTSGRRRRYAACSVRRSSPSRRPPSAWTGRPTSRAAGGTCASPGPWTKWPPRWDGPCRNASACSPQPARSCWQPGRHGCGRAGTRRS
jgi:uncharacterized protein YyaL (SSP411 family)